MKTMKQRFSSLDVRATVSTLQESIVGLRLQNVYDVNSRTYLFKFAKPDRKEMVLIEAGIRLHTTLYLRDKSITPSGFCIKLRKHLRTRRLTGVKQLGADRIVDYEFGTEDLNNTYHVIAEFYAAGNLILTDGHYRILSILRVVEPNEKVKMAVGEIYDVSAFARSLEPITKEAIVRVLQTAGPKDMLKKVINAGFDYGPALTEHALTKAGLASNVIVSTGFDTSEGSPDLEALFTSLQEADRIMEGKGQLNRKGYIIMLKHNKKNPDDPDEKELVTYDEFHPYLFAQHESKTYREFESFDAAVDEFFSAIESQRLELKRRAQEDHAQKKLDTVKMEHFGRVKGLEEAQQKNVLRAELIEANLEMCDQAIMIIRNAIATGMDWKDLADLVEEEKKHGNPIALMIESLKLESNQICLLLSDPYEEEEDEAEEGEDRDDQEDQEVEDRHQPKPKATMRIDLDIYLTAFANARNYYDVKKQSAIKHEKTLAHASKAFKSAEKKIRQDLQEVKITTSIHRVRKPYWFEKFMWFITSENFLVIAGKDAQQNELIVKRYMKKDDVYVHADIHGAATVLIKNPSDKEPVPPSSLYQAGIMSVCQSKAWDAKIVTSAYWVRADQVSKSAPTGEYLTTGSFMIRGKKNFLPPVQLVYGFGFLFKLDDSSIGNHLNERRVLRAEDADEKTGTPRVGTPSRDKDVVDRTGTPRAGTPSKDQHSVEREHAEVRAEEHSAVEQQQQEEEAEKDEDLEGSDGEEEEDEEKNPGSGNASQSNEATGEKQDDGETESGSESESEAESSEDEFPDTQIQFNKKMATPAPTATLTKNGGDKYALEDYGHDSNDEAEKGDDTSSLASSERNQQKSGYITAKMRRDMKKGKPLTAGEGEDEPSSPKEVKAEAVQSKKQTVKKPAAAPAPAPVASVRGKKGKAKKIKEKYADQDEEERQLRLELLAPDKGPQLKGKRAKKEAEKKAEKEALAEKRRLQQDEYAKSHPSSKKGGNNNKANGGKPNNNKKGGRPNAGAPPTQSAAELSGSVETEEGTIIGGGGIATADDDQEGVPMHANGGGNTEGKEGEDEAEEVRRLLQEENIKMLEPEDMENLTVLDGLTGRPLITDLLQFAVPVCAPYGALQKFKYKVKLIPGTMKKGKAVKTAVNHFLTVVNAAEVTGIAGPAKSYQHLRAKVASATAAEDGEVVQEGAVEGMTAQEQKEAEAALEMRERELIKMVKDEEAINCMMGKVKISAPGVEASKKSGKGSKGRK